MPALSNTEEVSMAPSRGRKVQVADRKMVDGQISVLDGYFKDFQL